MRAAEFASRTRDDAALLVVIDVNVDGHYERTAISVVAESELEITK